ncbi:hypothetical protein SAMN02799622_01198 [Methylobacterium sp. UNC378MF]|uniref:hypothetical protein n=1 Tax=Methylobacterium sp. UNC378MF TaxID=1502748 RepID=UPI0008808378|nr:hypothetical protein [Methylobacterium sp. UNC378MF]SDA14775.1 hypothetical protein SAMN02799622_01198 [Methylobacterium sp. UNC378MF]
MEGPGIAHLMGAADAAVEAKAAQVGADILAQYRKLATDLRRRGSDEVVAMEATLDPKQRACHQYAFELYGTAASELDDVIADLLESLECPSTAARGRALIVLDGGRAHDALRNEGPR